MSVADAQNLFELAMLQTEKALKELREHDIKISNGEALTKETNEEVEET